MLGRFCFFSFPPGVGFATTGGLWACGSCPFLHAPFSDFIFMGFIQDSPCCYCLDFQTVSGLSVWLLCPPCISMCSAPASLHGCWVCCRLFRDCVSLVIPASGCNIMLVPWLLLAGIPSMSRWALPS